MQTLGALLGSKGPSSGGGGNDGELEKLKEKIALLEVQLKNRDQELEVRASFCPRAPPPLCFLPCTNAYHTAAATNQDDIHPTFRGRAPQHGHQQKQR